MVRIGKGEGKVGSGKLMGLALDVGRRCCWVWSR